MLTVGGVKMALPIMVGAGVCKTPESTKAYLRPDVSVGAVCTGSYTLELRTGNEGVLFWPSDEETWRTHGIGLNSYGMPNMGFSRAARELPLGPGKPLIVSIAGFSVADYVYGVEVFDSHPGIAAIELNFGCPNTHEKRKVPIAYDLDSLSKILGAIRSSGPKKPVWVKLSPYLHEWGRISLSNYEPEFDFSQVPVVDEAFVPAVLGEIMESEFVRAIVLGNTLPNVIRRENGKPVTTPQDGKAGLSGALLKPIALDLVRFAARAGIDIIGAGGVRTGADVLDFLEAGAKAVYATSGPFWSGRGPKFFTDLIVEDENLLAYLTELQPA